MIEFIISLYLLSGLVKPTLMLIGLEPPVDYVYLCLPIMFVFVMKRLVEAKHGRKLLTLSNPTPFVLFIIFSLYAIFTGVYSLSYDYYALKVLYVLQNVFTAFVVLLLDKKHIIKIFKFIIYITIASGVIFLLFYNRQYESYAAGDVLKAESGLELYLTLGLIAGLSFFLWYYMKNSLKYGKLIMLLLVGILLLSSARGPIIFTFGCFLLFLVLEKKIGFVIRTVLIGIALIVLATQFFPENPYVERFENRFSALLNPNSNASNLYTVRDNLYGHAFDMISERPIFGYGLGSFGKYLSGNDVRSYPHNFVYEIFAEIGFVGLLLFLLFISSSVRVLLKANNLLFAVMIGYLLLNLAKGHSIVEVKFFYFLVFSLISISAPVKLEYEYK